jgi:hypothetical protein
MNVLKMTLVAALGTALGVVSTFAYAVGASSLAADSASDGENAAV